MNDYSKFNVSYTINDVVFIDCRTFYSVGKWLYHRVGADLYNSLNCILNSTEVENIVIQNNLNYADLITENQMNNEIVGE